MQVSERSAEFNVGGRRQAAETQLQQSPVRTVNEIFLPPISCLS